MLLKDKVGALRSINIFDETHDNVSSPFSRVLIRVVRFIVITAREFIADRLMLRSMGLTYATLLSLIPLLVISFSVFKLFGGSKWFDESIRPFILATLAPGSGPKVVETIEQVIDNAGSATLGGIGVVMLVVAVYAIFSGIESTFNSIWGINAKTGGLKRLPVYWGLVTIIPIFIVGSFAVSTYIRALPMVHQAVERITFAQSLLNQLVPFLLVTLSFFLLYRFLPKTSVRNRAALLGAIVAGVLYETVKQGFIAYTGRLVQYDVIYGSMAVLPLILIWINLAWQVLLIGVEISFVTQHYSLLLTKRKNYTFSRNQHDALAYLMLTEATSAFRGIRRDVMLGEWSARFSVPPKVAEEIAEKLRCGHLIQRAGDNEMTILLSRDPATISLQEVDDVLAGASGTEWEWPGEKTWIWLKKWMRKRSEASRRAAGIETLEDIINELESRINPKKREKALEEHYNGNGQNGK